MPHSDPILEAFLSESLGGQSPPDLRDRILSALAEKNGVGVNEAVASNGVVSNGATNGKATAVEPVAPPVQPPPLAETVDQPQPTPRANKVARQRSSDWLFQAGVVTAAVLFLGLISFAVYYNTQSGSPIAQTDSTESTDGSPTDGGANPKVQPGSEIANNDGGEVTDPITSSDSSETSDGGESIVVVPPKQVDPVTPQPRTPFVVDNHVVAASNPSEVAKKINAAVAEVWKEQRVTPTETVNDEQWVARAYGKIIGRQPTEAELATFQNSKASQPRVELVNTLAASPEFAKHWAGLLANDLLGANGSPESREGLRTYLEEALKNNTPFNQAAYDMLTATGSSNSQAEDYNPALNFVAAVADSQAVATTSHVARGLLGKNLACAKCHDQSIASFKQQEFWQLNAFFRQMKVQRKGGDWKVSDADFVGQDNEIADAEVYYETPQGELRVAYPAFAGVKIDPSGDVSKINRRHELGKLVAYSPELSRTVVNRVWAKMFGYGFTNPVDDIGPANEPSHPELLTELAGEFESHDYQISLLVKALALSKPFALSSEATSGSIAFDVPELGSKPMFSRYYSRSQSPALVGDSLQVALKAHNAAGLNGQANRANWMGDFARVVGGGDKETGGIIQQIADQPLIATNDYLLQNAVSPQHQTLIARIAASKLSRDEKVNHLFLAALGREPTKQETRLANEIVGEQADSAQAMQAVWWALLNGR